MKKALIIIDFQNDFIFPDAIGSPEAEALIPKMLRKIMETQDDIYYTLDLHQTETYTKTVEGANVPKHCIVNTMGVLLPPRIANALDRKQNVVEVKKDTFAFTQWPQVLTTPYDEFEICGLVTDICVLNNALLLRSLYPTARIVVNSQLCAGTTVENHQKALNIMRINCIEVFK